MATAIEKLTAEVDDARRRAKAEAESVAHQAQRLVEVLDAGSRWPSALSTDRLTATIADYTALQRALRIISPKETP